MDYRETRIHGEAGLPISMYFATPQNPRYYMNCHWHPEHEIIYMLQGTLKLRLGVGEETFLLKKGDVVFVSGGTLHSAIPTDAYYVCFVLDPGRMLSGEDACAKELRKMETGEMRVTPLVSREHSEFAAICEELVELLHQREEGFFFFVQGLVLRFFGYLLRFGLYEGSRIPIPAEEKGAGHMKLALDHIQKNYHREITLSELARLADMSPNYFCRYFRKLTGQTPIEYLISYRLESARYALENTDLSVTDIAFACGFNDVSHFIKRFRKAYGATPKTYRMGQWEG